VVAGPLATRVLADHGAEVIKLERLDAPHAGRDGALFGNLNRGKQSIAMNLADPRGAALARRLAARCDVVIDNFSPRVMAQFGLDAAALRALHPGVLSVSLSGFGADGPYADRVSYGPTLQAQTGFTWHMRARGGAPAGWGFAYADMASGYAAALAVLSALLSRAAGREGAGLLAGPSRRSACGGRLDLAQLEIAAALIGPALAAARAGAAIDDAVGNDAPEGLTAPHGIYRCRDRAGGGLAAQRWCAIVVFDDADWQRCAAVIGDGWAQSAAFASAALRLQHAAELDAHLAAWTRVRGAEAVVAALQAAGVAAGLVADAADLRSDPQLAARRYWHAAPGGATLDGVIPRLSLTAGAIAAPAPRRGQHTEQLLRDLLGMEQSAVDRLKRDGVIA
jgi:crotonobetainyl-CoA:carnitine CoA-transferase CaiB-like acyl-CoA transferase